MKEIALIENLQRDDLNPIETAYAMKYHLDYIPIIITTINANLNPVFIQNLYVYDLHLENNIWAFIIECKDDLEDNGVMTLEVSIDYYKSGWAYCNKNDINNKLLMCKVNSTKKK